MSWTTLNPIKKNKSFLSGMLLMGLISVVAYFSINHFTGSSGSEDPSQLIENNNEAIIIPDAQASIMGRTYNSNFNIYIKDNLKKEIISEYDSEMENPYCLEGDYDGTAWTMHTMLKPEIFYQNPTNTSFACPSNTMMVLHTHPNGNCLFSPEDIFTFGKKSGYTFLYGVYCGEGKFNIIDKQMNNYKINN